MHTVLGSDIPLLSCKMCKLPQYCSVTCQTVDWRKIHSKMCCEKLKSETYKRTHWSTPFVTRYEALSVEMFGPLSMSIEEGTVSSAWSSVMSRLSSPSRGGRISAGGSRDHLFTEPGYSDDPQNPGMC